MSRKLVFDAPTRVFHWIFAILFLTAFIVDNTVSDESPVFYYHMLAGMTLTSLVFVRIIWGFIGTKHAKFSGFSLKPTELINYFRGILAGKKHFWAGHNPATSWAAIAMMTVTLLLGFSGCLMVSGSVGGLAETVEESHEIIAYIFMGLVAAHILGIIVHTVRLKDFIGLSIIDGKKKHIKDSETIKDAKTIVGLALLVFVISVALYLLRNYDSATRTLRLFGGQMQLGEVEEIVVDPSEGPILPKDD